MSLQEIDGALTEQQQQIGLSSLGTDPDTAFYLGKQFLGGGESCRFESLDKQQNQLLK